jgi:hypothetical protein
LMSNGKFIRRMRAEIATRHTLNMSLLFFCVGIAGALGAGFFCVVVEQGISLRCILHRADHRPAAAQAAVVDL